MISQIGTKWQLFFKIQDGGDRHLEFLQMCIYNVIDMFQIEVPMFSLILVTIGQILKKWQQFSKFKMAAVQTYGSKFGGFSDRRPPYSKFEGTKSPKGTCFKRNTTFEPLSVQFGPKLRPVGWPRKLKKNK